MMKNRLAGIVLFVLLALHSLAVVARSLQRLKWQPLQHSGALEVNIVLSDSAIQASQTTFALGVPYHCVVKNGAPVAQEANPEPGSAGPLSYCRFSASSKGDQHF